LCVLVTRELCIRGQVRRGSIYMWRDSVGDR
jgi:hypothetical protein